MKKRAFFLSLLIALIMSTLVLVLGMPHISKAEPQDDATAILEADVEMSDGEEYPQADGDIANVEAEQSVDADNAETDSELGAAVDEPAVTEEAPTSQPALAPQAAPTPIDSCPANSLGFFQWMGHTDAVNLMTGSDNVQVAGYTNVILQNSTHYDDMNDATTLANMKQALENLKVVNSFRAGQELQVSSYAMAVSQLHVNWEYATRGGAYPNSGSTMDVGLSSPLTFNDVTEININAYTYPLSASSADNAAWGYKQRTVYEGGNSARAKDWAQLVNTSFTAGGYAVHGQMNDNMKIDGLSGEDSWQLGKPVALFGAYHSASFRPSATDAMSFDEYYAKFKEFCRAKGYDFWDFDSWKVAPFLRSDTPQCTYDGSPQVVLVYDGADIRKEGIDYTVSYQNNVNAGTATATITGLGDYAGKSRTIEFEIAPRNLNFVGKDSSEGIINNLGKSFKWNTYDYCNAEIKPVPGSETAYYHIYTVGFYGYDRSRSYDSPNGSGWSTKDALEEGVDYTLEYSDNIDPGKGKVTYVGKGNYTGSATIEFTIAVNKDKCHLEVEQPVEYVYDRRNSTVKPTVKLVANDDSWSKTLETDTYTVSYSASERRDVGSYEATVNNAWKFFQQNAGTLKTTFQYQVVPRDISSARFGEITPKTYTGSAIEPAANAYVDLGYLNAEGSKVERNIKNDLENDNGKGVTISYKNNTNSGTATITYTAKPGGNWKGSASTTFMIRKSIANSTTNAAQNDFSFTVADQVWAGGKAIHPKPVVKDTKTGKTLVENTDYTLTYNHEKNPDNKNVGTGWVTVTAGLDGSFYTGTRTVSFQISKRDIAKASVAGVKDQKWTGSAIEQKPTITWTDGTKLVYDTDYSLSFKDNKNEGTATITIKGKGNYQGSQTVTFKITKDAVSDVSLKSATAKDQTYTGSALKPAVTVKDANGVTVAASAYTVTYANNIKAGTATATVTAKAGSGYTGTVKATFKISPKSISSATITGVTDKAWTGKAITQTPTVKDGSTTLKAGTDYTLSYKNNVNAGTATLTITGKGNYTGSVSKTFKITKAVDTKSVPVYWIQHKVTGENLYTTDKNEVTVLAKGNWKNMGIIWYAPTSGTPVYRLNYRKGVDHHYVTDPKEAKALTASPTWDMDNSGKPMFYSGGSIRLWRLYSDARAQAWKKGQKISGFHMFATSDSQAKTLSSNKWKWTKDDTMFQAVKLK